MKERAGETGADATPARTHRNALTPVRRRAPSARQPERLDLSASGLGPQGVHQRATSEILSVVATSSGELEPAFETLLGNVTRLCHAKFSILHLREGDNFRMAAAHAAPQAYVEWRRRHPLIGVNAFPPLPLARLARTKAVQHVPDLTSERAYIERAPPMVALVEAAGARRLLCISMLKGEHVIGAIAIYHQERRPFDEERIAVVKNFASRAVIAVESARGLKALWLVLFAWARSINLSADQILFSAGQLPGRESLPCHQCRTIAAAPRLKNFFGRGPKKFLTKGASYKPAHDVERKWNRAVSAIGHPARHVAEFPCIGQKTTCIRCPANAALQT